MKPRFTHDCTRCVFTGADAEYDFYFCPGSLGGSIIARFGNDGPEYASSAVDVWRSYLQLRPDRPLSDAWRAAEAKGLIQ